MLTLLETCVKRGETKERDVKKKSVTEEKKRQKESYGQCVRCSI